MSNVTDFINKISKIKKDETVSVVLPSSNKTAKFTPVNVKQQKELLKFTIEGVDGALPLVRALNEIILTNLVDTDIEISSIDKYPILLDLRRQSLGETVKINDKHYKLTDLPAVDSIELPNNTCDISINDIIISLQIPTLEVENAFLTKGIDEVQKSKDKSVESTFTMMYLYEVIKFVTKISFAGNEISFSSLSLDQKKTVIESLPISINQKILDYINEVRKYENSLITFSDETIVPISTLFFSQE